MQLWNKLKCKQRKQSYCKFAEDKGWFYCASIFFYNCKPRNLYSDFTRSIILSISTNIWEYLLLQRYWYSAIKKSERYSQRFININCTRSIILLAFLIITVLLIVIQKAPNTESSIYNIISELLFSAVYRPLHSVYHCPVIPPFFFCKKLGNTRECTWIYTNV